MAKLFFTFIEIKTQFLKNTYLIIAVITLFAQSCTIQKRQHMPGYHIEWNTKDAHSEVHSEKTPECALDIAKQDIALAVEVVAQPLEQEVQANHSVAEVTSPRDLHQEGATGKGNEAVKIHSEKRTKQSLTFSSIIHAPANVLFGGVQPEGETRTDRMSIAAMVCGILAFFVPYVGIILAILAIIFGGIGLRRTRSNPELKGKGMAIAGLVLGIVGLLFVVLAAAILASFFLV